MKRIPTDIHVPSRLIYYKWLESIKYYYSCSPSPSDKFNSQLTIFTSLTFENVPTTYHGFQIPLQNHWRFHLKFIYFD